MTAQERGRKFRLLNKVKIAAKCREKRKAAREAAALAGTPMLKPGQNRTDRVRFRICNCGTCKVCVNRINNTKYRKLRQLGTPTRIEKELKLKGELDRMDFEAELSLNKLRDFRQYEPLLRQSSPLA